VSTPDALKIRELEWRDLTDLSENYFLAYRERDRGDPIWLTLFRVPPSPEEQVSWFSRMFQRALAGDLVTRVAEVGGHAVGMVSVQRVGPNRDAEVGHLGELGILIHHDHRGKGIGSALFASVIEACRGKFDLVRLSVFVDNTPAIALYRKFGFVPYGRLPAAVRRAGKYYDEDLMFLDLRPPVPKG
jgi:RimJ/RimL family protein N-acetyltransferase